MNVFLLDYYTRVNTWYNIRKEIESKPIIDPVTAIDSFWQQCPLVTHYLHPSDISNWPTPWELLRDNTYCYIARGLGMYYTLVMLGITDIDFCVALDDNNENVAIVIVDQKKYIMNYWPRTIMSNKISSFKIITNLDISTLKNKIF